MLIILQVSIIICGIIALTCAYFLNHDYEIVQFRSEKLETLSEVASTKAPQHKTLAPPSSQATIPKKVTRYRRKLVGTMEEVPDDIAPASLTQTAKVTFKMTLEAIRETVRLIAPPAYPEESDESEDESVGAGTST